MRVDWSKTPEEIARHLVDVSEKLLGERRPIYLILREAKAWLALGTAAPIPRDSAFKKLTWRRSEYEIGPALAHEGRKALGPGGLRALLQAGFAYIDARDLVSYLKEFRAQHRRHGAPPPDPAWITAFGNLKDNGEIAFRRRETDGELVHTISEAGLKRLDEANRQHWSRIPLTPERKAKWVQELHTTPEQFDAVLAEMTGEGKIFSVDDDHLVANLPDDYQPTDDPRQYHADRWKYYFFREYGRAELEVTGDIIAVVLRITIQLNTRWGESFTFDEAGIAELLDVDPELLERTMAGAEAKGLITRAEK